MYTSASRPASSRGAVQAAVGVVHLQTLAQRVQRVALAGEHLPGHQQGVGDLAPTCSGKACGRPTRRSSSFRKPTSKRGVVDDDLRARQTNSIKLIGHGRRTPACRPGIHRSGRGCAPRLRCSFAPGSGRGAACTPVRRRLSISMQPISIDPVAAFGRQAGGFGVEEIFVSCARSRPALLATGPDHQIRPTPASIMGTHSHWPHAHAPGPAGPGRHQVHGSTPQ